MGNLGVVFLTGLTTGGLSCLAVQGGLLASSVARQAEQEMQQRATTGATNQRPSAQTKHRQQLALPIVLFLGSKIVAYTLLGFLLGGLGSMLQLTPILRGILQIAIGIFMVGTALRMFNVHPIFHFFVLEPPSFLTRYIRKTAKASTQAIVAPLFLGALTVLIPCGITQAIMALAIGTANPFAGAAMMAAFTLGTSPVFFTLAYLATRIGKRWETRFLQSVATIVLLLGLVSIDTGLALSGSPISFIRLKQTFLAQQMDTQIAQATPDNQITIAAGENGYEPEIIRAKAGQPMKLILVTNHTQSCARGFMLPSLNIQKVLPETGTIVIDLPAQQAGMLPFACSMGMYWGSIQLE